MHLFILRHGTALERGDWAGSDAERPLTPRGRERTARAARTLAGWKLGLDVILTSPLVRAHQTATIVAHRLGCSDRLRIEARLDLGFDAERLASILREHAAAGAVMLVGHEPGLSAALGALLGSARLELKKGALACVRVPDPATFAGELRWLVTAKMLAAGR